MKRWLLVLLLLCLIQIPSSAILTLEYEDVFRYIDYINIEVKVETSIRNRIYGTKPLYEPKTFKPYLESALLVALREKLPESIRFDLGLDLNEEVAIDLIEEGRFDDKGNWDGEGADPLMRLLDKAPRLGTLLLTVSLEETAAGRNYAVVALQLYRGASLMLPERREKSPVVLDALVWEQRAVLIEGEEPLYKDIKGFVDGMIFVLSCDLQESRPDLSVLSPSK